MNDRLNELLRHESRRLAEEFELSSSLGRGTPQEISDFRENALQALLKRVLPPTYRVARGKIIDSFNNVSASIDCAILNPIHPFTVDSLNKFALIFADGVDCAIELKPDISNFDYLMAGLEQVRTVKRLRRCLSEGIKEWNLPHEGRPSKEEKEFYRTIPCFIFAMKGPVDLDNLTAKIITYYRDNEVPLLEQFDYIVLHRRGIVSNVKFADTDVHCCLKPDVSVPRTGFFWEEWEENTLAAFLMKISTVVPSIPRMFGEILPLYIKQRPQLLRKYADDDK